MIRKVLIALMVVLMVSSVASAMVVEDVQVPETLMAGDQLLILNGAGVRNVFLNDVYVGGLWLENPSADGNAIAGADEPMAIRIHVLNDFFASSKHINDAFKKGFRFAMPRGDISSIQGELERLEAAFADKITDGEEFDLIYLPGTGTSIYKEGVLKDTIPGLEFKRLFFGIWVSDKATVNDELKEGMLAGKISPEALAAQEQWKEKATAMADAKAAAELKASEEAAAKAAAKAEAMAAAEAKAAEEAAMKVAAVSETKATEDAAMKAAAAEKAKAAEEKAAMKAAAEKEAAVKAAGAAEVMAVEETKAAAAEVAVTRDNFGDQDVFFGVNSAALNADAKKALAAKAKWMKSNPAVSVAVEVYCDSRGSQEYNMALAKKRANSVVSFMTEAGIDASRMETVVFGAVESAANENAWANNRRAHFKIK